MDRLPLRAYDTVLIDTPAARATSSIVATVDLIVSESTKVSKRFDALASP
jgi:hypothetical protein